VFFKTYKLGIDAENDCTVLIVVVLFCMKMKNLNEKVVSEINRRLPKNANAVNYLMDLLYLGKESAYRRLKSQIPFTLEEVAAIANDLGFSLDKIIGSREGSRVFFDMKVDLTKSSSELYIDLLQGDIKIMKELNSAKDLKIISAINRIPLRFLPFQNLFKFVYFRYLHSKGDLSIAVKFSDVVVPNKINELYREAARSFSNLNNITCVTNHAVFSRIIKSVQYCYQTGIISIEDLRLLQKELFEMLAFIERLFTTGGNDLGANYSIYYSYSELETNCVCYEYDGTMTSQIWLFPESPIVIDDNRLIYQMQKNWLEARMKYATLVTKSNNLLQAKIIKELYDQTVNMEQEADFGINAL